MGDQIDAQVRTKIEALMADVAQLIETATRLYVAASEPRRTLH